MSKLSSAFKCSGAAIKWLVGWLMELETDALKSIGMMVDHGQEHLEVEKEQLMVKLKAVEVKMEEDQGLHQNLVEIVANCEEIK